MVLYLLVMNQEPCPFRDSAVTSVTFTCNGGVMVIEEYGLKVIVPRGAIEDHCVVEIEAAASLFGPFAIPNDCRPVSAYVWIAAKYMFKKLIQIEFEHHADVEDASKFCILKACCHAKCSSSPHHHEMHNITRECNYRISGSFCTLFTNLFCSYCLATKSSQIPDRIVAYHYLPENYESVKSFRAEVCFCYDINICKKVRDLTNLQH